MQVLGLWLNLNEIFLGLGLTVTEINIKIVQKQEIKTLKMTAHWITLTNVRTLPK